MAWYDVKFSCGHEERKQLYGKTSDRHNKIAYWEREGICTACWREQQEIEKSIGCKEVEMLYREYKLNYSDCKTKAGSYNGEKKTIVVYVPEEV